MEKKKLFSVWLLDHNKENILRVCERYKMTLEEMIKFIGRFDVGYEYEDVMEKVYEMRSKETALEEKRRADEKRERKEYRRKILAEVKAKMDVYDQESKEARG